MAQPALVIFDCDGVLVDSEPISIDVLLQVVAEAGVEVSQERAYDEWLGRSMASVTASLHACGLDFTEEHLEQVRSRLYTRFRDELQPIPHVAQALSDLDLPCCVASSSVPERLAVSLSVTGLLPFFDPHVFSSSMVENGKPAPDLFLHAAEQMGVAPSDCVVIEDSAAGITAARAAGMRVIGFVGGGHAIPAKLNSRIAKLAPDAIVTDMRELGATIASVN